MRRTRTRAGAAGADARGGARGSPSSGPPGASPEAGFALLVVILALIGLGALATGGFLLTRTDYEITANHRGAVEAGLVAQRGLARYLADHRRPGADTTYVFGGDTAEVTLTRLLESDPTTRDTVLRVASRGVRILPRGGVATRTVSQLLLWGGVSKPFTAAAAGGGDVDLNSEDAVLSGVDACAAGPDVAGASVRSGGWVDREDQQVYGSPPVDSSYASGREVLRAADFDSATWAGVRSESDIWPDVTITQNDAWPDFDTIPADRWLVIVFQQQDGQFDMEKNYSGRGTIITRGQFQVNKGGFTWDGLILAGGQLQLKKSDLVVEGAALGGLNELLGLGGGKLEILGNNTRIQYSSCNADVASRVTFRRLAVMPGTWVESF